VLKVNPEAGCAGGRGTSVSVAIGSGTVVGLTSTPPGSTLAADLPQAAIVSVAAISSAASSLSRPDVLIMGILFFVDLTGKIDPFKR
jgi:hypothetical protein